MEITIYHNPRCSKSRATLELIREAGLEPLVVDYLNTPPTRTQLKQLNIRLGIPVRDMLRSAEPIYAELNLGSPGGTDDVLLDALVSHPILLNRPIVVTKRGALICRPPERVLELF